MNQHPKTRARRGGKTPEQVAVFAIRRRNGNVEVCLIRRKGSRMWSIPKGFIDPGDTPEQAVLTEAHEEAGLQGRVKRGVIGTYSYEKRGAGFTVAVYVMEVMKTQSRWMEESFRERRWTPLAEATSLLAKHPVRRVWSRAKPLLTNSLRSRQS
jgi:8-oxo-dGTP pyrophosphatase MutT (NUDIX family)